jgi:hypothetical protein
MTRESTLPPAGSDTTCDAIFTTSADDEIWAGEDPGADGEVLGGADPPWLQAASAIIAARERIRAGRINNRFMW